LSFLQQTRIRGQRFAALGHLTNPIANDAWPGKVRIWFGATDNNRFFQAPRPPIIAANYSAGITYDKTPLADIYDTGCAFFCATGTPAATPGFTTIYGNSMYRCGHCVALPDLRCQEGARQPATNHRTIKPALPDHPHFEVECH
jgi:hypothetical protein